MLYTFNLFSTEKESLLHRREGGGPDLSQSGAEAANFLRKLEKEDPEMRETLQELRNAEYKGEEMVKTVAVKPKNTERRPPVPKPKDIKPELSEASKNTLREQQESLQDARLAAARQAPSTESRVTENQAEEYLTSLKPVEFQKLKELEAIPAGERTPEQEATRLFLSNEEERLLGGVEATKVSVPAKESAQITQLRERIERMQTDDTAGENPPTAQAA